MTITVVIMTKLSIIFQIVQILSMDWYKKTLTFLNTDNVTRTEHEAADSSSTRNTQKSPQSHTSQVSNTDYFWSPWWFHAQVSQESALTGLRSQTTWFLVWGWYTLTKAVHHILCNPLSQSTDLCKTFCRSTFIADIKKPGNKTTQF